MAWLLNVIVDLWCSLMHIQRNVDDSSVIGKSEFEKEGPSLLWGVVIGVVLLSVAGIYILTR
jgi:hypothetical protein